MGQVVVFIRDCTRNTSGGESSVVIVVYGDVDIAVGGDGEVEGGTRPCGPLDPGLRKGLDIERCGAVGHFVNSHL